ncbi:MAG TPA: DUF3015 family protein [Nitrospirota bacterium]|nr:DUF3015 family protein [Nitrospirota bacterium]
MKITSLALVISLLLVFVVGTAFGADASGEARKNTGCGLGTLIFQDKADNSTVLQSLQATTNDILGNQTFGITSGTSECKQPSKFAKNDRLIEFMVANMDNLAKEIAMGRGETLEAFAELLRVPANKRPEFYQKLQANFAQIFTSENVQLAKVVDNVVTVSSY